MKRLLYLLILYLLPFTLAMAQKTNGTKQYQMFAVGFYNLENLFDTIHDAGKRDQEYLPDGANKWGSVKYSHKLHNMSRALADMGTDRLPVGCAVIGVSEVENAKALTDLVNQPRLKQRNMKFCHIEGPDRRGVDCALLYNPALFRINDATLYPYVPELEKDSNYYTRGFLTVKGQLAGEDIAVIVCHWPSRFTGSFYRESAGRQVRHIKDSLIKENPELKVFVMGDMNDDPQNRSMARELRAKRDIADMRPRDMYNPWWKILDDGNGTLAYQGRWNLFDQIALSPKLLNLEGEKDYSTLKYFRAEIQRFPYLLQEEGAYKGTPKRTHAGGVWLDGFSDHLPVVVYLVKEKSDIPPTDSIAAPTDSIAAPTGTPAAPEPKAQTNVETEKPTINP